MLIFGVRLWCLSAPAGDQWNRTGFAGRWMRLEQAGSRGFRQQALLMREHVVRRYEEWGLDGDVLAVVSALTVGDKSDLTPELKATFSASGASHVLALSGLHIGILAGILTLLLYPLRLFPLGRSLTGVLTVLLLWAFAFLSGLSASVVRAVTMFSLYVGASFFWKDVSPDSCLCRLPLF